MNVDTCCESKTDCSSQPESCCGEAAAICNSDGSWIIGEYKTVKGAVPVVSVKLSYKDRLGACKARFGIGRMNYKVNPGLYAVGSPDSLSPVLVSANYKLTFDALRKELSGMNCWLLILDTNGVNVWCAAGKGTFGTEELVRQINAVVLSDIMENRTLILPQLGAPGINAGEILRRTGFRVIYGPVRAKDIKSFISLDMKADKAMRTVTFTAWERLVLTPIELLSALKMSLTVLGLLFIVNLFAAKPFDQWDLLAYLGAVLIGSVLTPLFLPVIPGRMFAWKGWLLGLIWSLFIVLYCGWLTSPYLLRGIGFLLVLPAVSAYFAMNFTGSSTYTSFSGVIKEMKIWVPIIAVLAVPGTISVLLSAILG